MELYIGGFAQGKLAYVEKKHPGLSAKGVLDGAVEDLRVCAIINHLHLWIRRKLAEGKNPAQELEEFLTRHPDSVLICDEIGNGIVPVEQAEREYREYTGRLLCTLAEQAVCVERVICGIGQRIK